VKERIIIVGGPRRGKSTMAGALAEWREDLTGNRVLPRSPIPIYCGDPLSKVKEPVAGVHYLPEGIPISGDDGAAQWVADNWFSKPGPWVCEGWVMARALRRWVAGCDARGIPYRDLRAPADRIVVLDRPGFGMPSKGQEAMHKAVMTVWGQVQHWFVAITEYA
jgi:hypothetical protein